MPRLPSALALGLRLTLASALTTRCGRIARRWPVRILRILPQLLNELRQLLAQVGDAPLELRDPRVLGSELRIPTGERLLELRDPLIPPILRHRIAASPNGGRMESGKFLWNDLEHLRGP